MNGALIGEVLSESPAEKGGMKVGDVILKINKTDIKGFKDLLKIIGKSSIGSTLKVSIWRDRRLINIYVKVTERP